MKKLIRKLFLAKEIKSKDGVLHFRRWRILSTPIISIYIHRIYKEDQDPYLHDHPWNYFGLIINGSYTEQTPNKLNVLMPGAFAFKKATDFHKIQKLNTDSVTTLFITGRRIREWGYKIYGYWVPNQYYRFNKTDIESKLTQTNKHIKKII